MSADDDADGNESDTVWDLVERVTPLLVTGAWMAALFLDVNNWWVILVVGYAVVVPLVSELSDYMGSRGGDDGTVRPSDPVDRLRQRYVAGELTEEEFEARLDDLLGGDSGTGREQSPRRGRHKSGAAGDAASGPEREVE